MQNGHLVGRWGLDGAHTTVGFSVKHMMIATVRGRFDDFDGEINFDEDSARSWANATIRTASISTHDPKRDAHLRSPDFLNAEQFPELTFASRSVEMTSDGSARVQGDLTIRDVTRPVVLDVTLDGVMDKDLYGGTRASLTATTSFNRKDFGLTWNQAIEGGGVLVGDRVNVTIDVSAVKQVAQEEVRAAS